MIFHNKGVQLAIIGNGRVKDLKKSRNVTGYQGILLTDPIRDSYKYLNFKNCLTYIIRVRSFTQTFSAFKATFMPGLLQGNALQQEIIRLLRNCLWL